MRTRDLHLLTVGRFTYTSDDRFKAVHQSGSHDWMLKIHYVQNRDDGGYECQVSTTPPLSHTVYLHVVGEYPLMLSIFISLWWESEESSPSHSHSLCIPIKWRLSALYLIEWIREFSKNAHLLVETFHNYLATQNTSSSLQIERFLRIFIISSYRNVRRIIVVAAKYSHRNQHFTLNRKYRNSNMKIITMNLSEPLIGTGTHYGNT